MNLSELQPRGLIPGLDSDISGDFDGFDEFVNKHRQLIEKCVTRRCRKLTVEDRQDVIQATYVDLAGNDFEILRAFQAENDETFRKFLWRTTDNVCRRHIAALKKENRFIDEYVSQEALHDLGHDSGAHFRSTTPTPEEMLMDIERNSLLESAMSELPDKYPETLWMIAEGETHTVIAKKLGVPKGTIDTRAKRGVNHLKKIVRRKYPMLLDYASEL